MFEQKGKMIVLYGANNLGKSYQMEVLQQTLKGKGLEVVRLKYPIYDLEPTGPIINKVLRGGLQMEELQVQRTYARNRRDFQPQLQEILDAGTWVVAEDYTGTGIAWGLTRGLELPTLEEMNQDLLREDLSILMYGERFRGGIEVDHRNERDEVIWQLGQKNHLFLADSYHWRRVYATRPKEEVQADIWKIVQTEFPSLQS